MNAESEILLHNGFELSCIQKLLVMEKLMETYYAQVFLGFLFFAG
jgi:hypothetical protein